MSTISSRACSESRDRTDAYVTRDLSFPTATIVWTTILVFQSVRRRNGVTTTETTIIFIANVAERATTARGSVFVTSTLRDLTARTARRDSRDRNAQSRHPQASEATAMAAGRRYTSFSAWDLPGQFTTSGRSVGIFKQKSGLCLSTTSIGTRNKHHTGAVGPQSNRGKSPARNGSRRVES